MDDIRLLRANYLRGPNIWTYRPALEAWLDLGALEDRPSNTIPGFRDRLVALLPGLMEHHCGVGERGGFVQRLDGGTMAGHVLEHVVIELLNLGGMPTGFGQTRSTSRRGVYRMAFRARDERVARVALAQGQRVLAAALRGDPFDVSEAVEAVCDEIDRSYLDPSTASIVAAATERGIPHLRLNDGSLVQLGHGARQRRIWTSETSQTGAIAHGIARDESLARSILATCGVPVPEAREVGSADEAWNVALDIGLPVILKAVEGAATRSMHVDLSTEDAVRSAFLRGAGSDSKAIVERSIPGREHHLLVVGGSMVAAARGDESWVVGDGRSTVQELVDAQLNVSVRLMDHDGALQSRIRCAADSSIRTSLRRQGLAAESVPAEGMRVLIQRIGRDAEDCTDLVHPDTARVASLAARLVGLDVAGVDVIARDIGQPLDAQGGAVIDVHGGPGLLMHLAPKRGLARPVGRAIVDHLFPLGDDGRISVYGVAGSVGTSRIVRLIAWMMHLAGRHVGLASRDGVWLDRRVVDARDGSRWESGRLILMNHLVESAIVESSAESILRDGLPYDRCEVGLVHDLAGHQQLAAHDVFAPEQMYKVLRTQVDVVLSTGTAVLHAVEPDIVEMAELCDGEVVLYALDGDLAAIAAHRAQGGRAAFARGRAIVFAQGPAETAIEDLLEATANHAETDAATLAAVAAVWSRGFELDLIVTGIATFGTDLDPYSPRLAAVTPHAPAAAARP
jgi:cyanophycin synthetase